MFSFVINVTLYFLNFLGLLLICAGLFLYEDEEGKFQNKVDEWWIKLSDKQRLSRSRVAAFMQGIAQLTGRGFDRLLGRRLFSVRVVPVSIYLSFASFFLLVLILPHIKFPAGATRQGAFVMLLYFSALALMPAFLEDKWVLVVWWGVIPAALLSISGFLVFVFRTRGPRSTFYGIGLVALIFISSLFCDLVYIALTRYVLRRISGIDSIPEILLMILINLLALAIPVLGPIYVGTALSKYAPQAGATVLMSLIFNFIDFLAGFAALIVALLLLLHRLLWPAIQRPLYAICRFAPIKEKKWLFRFGVALLFLPNHFTIGVLRTILEKL
jgi:hypothetical protein